MKNVLFKPEARRVLSEEFLARAVQTFDEVAAHKDVALSAIQLLRSVPNSKHCLADRQGRYSF